jgi:hypothetical protein
MGPLAEVIRGRTMGISVIARDLLRKWETTGFYRRSRATL